MLSSNPVQAVFTRESNVSAAKLANLKLSTDRIQLQNKLDGGTVSLKGFKKLSGPRAKKTKTKTSKAKKCTKSKKVKGEDGCGNMEVGKLSIHVHFKSSTSSHTEITTQT